MENLLNIVETLPIWVKIVIPFIASFLFNVVFDLIKRGIKISL